jgi:hypothetical protein
VNKVRLFNAVEALRRGRARLAGPIGGWTQFAFARIITGQQVPANHPGALFFCARGALHCERTPTASPEINVAAWDANKLLENALVALIDRLASHGIRGEDFRLLNAVYGVSFWNDTQSRTVEQVLYLYDLAIELGESDLASAAA